MPFVYFGFVLAMMVWLFWAIAWVVVAATVMLVWPIALLLAGSLLWRLFRRRSWSSNEMRAETPREAASRNSAFEDYRQETMRRLDEESAKFREFLQRLRTSRDKKEFEAFMAARRGRPALPQGNASAG
jgi:ABC-type multidrug transport system fused ATPase/permease subunit